MLRLPRNACDLIYYHLIISVTIIMELLRLIKEEAGDYPKFESALAKTDPEDIGKGLVDGRTLLHIICSSGYTKYAHLLITAATKKGVLGEILDCREPQDN